MAVHTLRADEATITKLKNLADQMCLTQGQVLDDLISVWETQKLKDSAPSREAELNRFNAALRTAQEIYQHSVGLWLDADEQARATVTKQMQSLKDSNNDLLQQTAAMAADLAQAKATIAEQEAEIAQLREQIAQTQSLNDILQAMQSTLSSRAPKTRKKSSPENAEN